MDFRLPLAPDDSLFPHAHGPVSLWMLVALIGTVLGAAVVLAGVESDTRDVAHRHAAVLPSQAL
jgi:hypothetical protein